MSISNPLPYFILMTLFLFVSHYIVKLSPFYTRECGPSLGGRFEAIDGLRGYLALGVFFTHAVLSFYWYETGKWGGQQSFGIYGKTGHTAVSIFFIITGFLFWGKVLKTKGGMNWKAFYISRFSRLTPLYLFSVALVLVIVFIKTGFNLNVSLRQLAVQIISWLTFSIQEPMNMNGLKGTERINAGVLWTLAYEWKFYFALPLLAIFTKLRAFYILAIIFLTFYIFVPSERIIFNFLLGMMVAYAIQNRSWSEALKSRYASVVAISCFVILFLPLGNLMTWLEPLLLFTLFLIIAHGNGLFGLLTHPSAKYLGTISYSLYLLHGIILYIVLQLLHKIRPIPTIEPLEYWCVIAITGVLIIIVCGSTYRFIEHPFLIRKSP